MKEITKTGRTGIAALKSGMSRNTAAKYLKDGRLPSERKEPRDWRMLVSFDGVKGMVTGGDTLASMDMDAPTVDLSIYDTLLQRQEGYV